MYNEIILKTMMMVNIKATMQILKEIKVYTGNTLFSIIILTIDIVDMHWHKKE